MNIPGFTAESSLDQCTDDYTRGPRFSRTKAQVVPQDCYWAGGCYGCWHHSSTRGWYWHVHKCVA
jgi:hypothetical protein